MTKDRKRQRPLCRAHVERNLVVPHTMVDISGMGTLCEWCTDDDVRGIIADFLVDLQVAGGEHRG